MERNRREMSKTTIEFSMGGNTAIRETVYDENGERTTYTLKENGNENSIVLNKGEEPKMKILEE